MSHVVDDVVNPIGAITGIDPVKQATGFTGTGFDKKPAQSSQATQQAPASGDGGGSSGSSSMTTLLNQLAAQQVNKQPAPLPVQFSPAQVPQSGMGYGQQLSQLGPQPMQSAMNSMTKFFSQ